MHGVVSLLDSIYSRVVEDLWAELERTFAVEGVYVTPYPHFSYHVAPQYDIARLEAILRHFAFNSTAFRVRTAGLGIFTGGSPVLYIPVVRSPELTHVHATLWQQISQVSSDMQDYYHPDQWIPHITIGFGDMSKDLLPQIIRLLSERDFHWEVTINNLALIFDTGIRQELKSRFDFGKSE